MSTPSSQPKKPAPARPATKANVTKQLKSFHWFGLDRLLRDDAITIDHVANEANEMGRYMRMMTLVKRQAYIIGFLILVIMLVAPMVKNGNKFFFMTPDRKVGELTALDGPTLTNQAVLSWATMSITEILTVGFGNFDKHLNGQAGRFTDEGWESFVQAVADEGMRRNFMEQQLVLTTVPANAAVITAQGLNLDQQYQWVVELPIIMTYTTNNEKKQVSKAVIRLNIVRVASSENVGGLAIKSWKKS